MRKMRGDADFSAWRSARSPRPLPTRRIFRAVPLPWSCLFPPGASPTKSLAWLPPRSPITSAILSSWKIALAAAVRSQPAAVKQAPPDGYTLLVGDIGTHAINASLYSKLSYDPLKDFVPVIELVEMPHVLVVPSDSPFEDDGRSHRRGEDKPGSLTYASVGVGSGAHLLGEMLKSEHKIDIVHAPYRGSSQIVPDLMSNRVGLFFGAVGSMTPLIQEGRLRALMVTDRQRSSLLPNVPSAAEAGAPAMDLKVWFGVSCSRRNAGRGG